MNEQHRLIILKFQSQAIKNRAKIEVLDSIWSENLRIQQEQKYVYDKAEERVKYIKELNKLYEDVMFKTQQLLEF